MQIDRLAAHAPRSTRAARSVALMTEPCVGCPGCTGLCRTLLELMTLPETLLARGAAA